MTLGVRLVQMTCSSRVGMFGRHMAYVATFVLVWIWPLLHAILHGNSNHSNFFRWVDATTITGQVGATIGGSCVSLSIPLTRLWLQRHLAPHPTLGAGVLLCVCVCVCVRVPPAPVSCAGCGVCRDPIPRARREACFQRLVLQKAAAC